MRFHISVARALILANLSFAGAGCGDDRVEVAPYTPDAGPDAMPPVECPNQNQIGGVCVGAPTAQTQNADYCTTGVTCSKTTTVQDDATLQMAIAVAQPGECIVLAPGSYGTANLPAGVSLLGETVNSARLTGVTIGAGDGSVLQGLGVGADGVIVDGATNAQIVCVTVSDAVSNGIDIRANSSVSIELSTITGAKDNGILSTDAVTVAIDKSAIIGNMTGMKATETDSCLMGPMSMISVQTSIIRGNFRLGLNLEGCMASLLDVDIIDSTGDPDAFFEGGSGMAVSQCSDLDGKAVRVKRNKDFGVLVQQASGQLGGANEMEGVEISENRIGIWVGGTSIAQPFTLSNANVENNQGLGIGVSAVYNNGMIDKLTKGFIVCHSNVLGTTDKALKMVAQGMVIMDSPGGDGLAWLDGSEVTIETSTFSNNARNSILINGSANGTLKNITIPLGDKEPLQQSLSGMTTITVANTPFKTDAMELFPVPVGP